MNICFHLRKTTAVTELILQAVARKQKVLVTAPSNVAVDNLVERLAAFERAPGGASVRPRIVRLGHPARISPVIQRYCLDAVIFEHETQEIIADIRKEMTDLRAALNKKSLAGRWDERRQIRFELKALSKDVAKREKKIVTDIVRSSDVVLATCVGASSSLLNEVVFDMCVIDEAAQAIDVSCWIPMLRSEKCVMAGDHCQLPPTVLSKEAEQGGLADTLFHRIITGDRTKDCARLLDTQYRMHGHINEWASTEMYEGKLKSHSGNEKHTLSDITGLPSDNSLDAMQSCVVLLIDTSGCGLGEEEGEGGSVRNFGEAKLVLQHVARLVAAGVPEKEIGVITPYNAQVQLLKLMIRDSAYPHVSVKTVDGFQGGEREAIILSFVRSNEKHTVGFLSDKRRINVAVTRAKRHLAVIADSETCHSDPFLGRLMDYLSEVGEHRSAAELIGDADEHFGVIPDDVADASRQLPSSGVQVASATKTEKKSVVSKKAPNEERSAKAASKAKPSDSESMVPPRQGVELSEDLKKKIKADFEALISSFVNGSIEGGVVSIVSNISDGSVTHGPQCLVEMERLRASGRLISGSTDRSVIIFAVEPIMSNCLQFSSSLNAFQRLLVHEVAEAHSLGHRSEGEGTNRYIEVFKRIARDQTKNKKTVGQKGPDSSSAEVQRSACTFEKDSASVSSSDAESESEQESDDDNDDEQPSNQGAVAAVASNAKSAAAATKNPSKAPPVQSKTSKKQEKSSTAKKTGGDADDDDILALLDSEISKNKVIWTPRM
jgi:ATP-dependent RNA/DNA helicase IGHMBP2